MTPNIIERNRHQKDQLCQTWKRQFANVPTTSGSPMVNPKAMRMSIGRVLSEKFGRRHLKAQVKPQLRRTWIRYQPRPSPLKKRRSPDPEKANRERHSFSI